MVQWRALEMGLFNRFKRSAGNNNIEVVSADGHHTAEEDCDADKKKKVKTRRKSFFQFISPSDVTTESLQVWAGLPQKIRQDPSMASFQLECDRLHGEWYLWPVSALIGIDLLHLPVLSDEGLEIEVNNEETVLGSTLDISEITPNDDEEHQDEDGERNEFITIKMSSPIGSSPEKEGNENDDEITYVFKE